jgi:hypothetical protein
MAGVTDIPLNQNLLRVNWTLAGTAYQQQMGYQDAYSLWQTLRTGGIATAIKVYISVTGDDSFIQIF